ncbi:hypothetical protein A2U01_0057362 [Trifolium medium]|uniref:Uncharacterized protein n=1 Tax=Trifolium medium TaxID=97028 RepID=A0A392RK41_9FABA|nr:hypothetical protein [Trifolium medium]
MWRRWFSTLSSRSGSLTSFAPMAVVANPCWGGGGGGGCDGSELEVMMGVVVRH